MVSQPAPSPEATNWTLSPAGSLIATLAATESISNEVDSPYLSRPMALSAAPESYREAYAAYTQTKRPRSMTLFERYLASSVRTGPKPTEVPVTDEERISRALFAVREAEKEMTGGRLDNAVQAYRNVLRLYPRMTFAHQQLGRLSLMQGRFKDAIDHFIKSLEADEYLVDNLTDIGAAYLYSGRIRESITWFEAARETSPTSSEPLFNQGVALRRLGEIDQAMHIFQQYGRLFARDARLHRELGVLASLNKNPLGALDHFARALELDANWSTPLLDAALLHARLNNRTMAIACLDRALELAPPASVLEVYRLPAFRDIRLSPDGKPFEARLAKKARDAI